MNAVRSVISVFMLALLAVSIAGWIWAGDLPSAKMAGARLVLAICGLAAIGGLWLLWTAKQPQVELDGTLPPEAAQANGK